MIYWLIQPFVKIGLQWFVTDMRIENRQDIQTDLPTIFVGNKANSFFDALILSVFHKKEIYCLTNGKLFDKPIYNWLLRSMNLLPIHKNEGLFDTPVHNAFTYEECATHLKNGKHILILPDEPLNNHLQFKQFLSDPVDQLLQMCYRKEIPVIIRPYSIEYSSLSNVPKAVKISVLPSIDSTDFIADHAIQSRLIVEKIQRSIQEDLELNPLSPTLNRQDLDRFLVMPATIGYYTQYWFYKFWKNYCRKATKGTEFYDILLFGCLLFSYPIFVLIISVSLGYLFGVGIAVLSFLLLPFTSYCMAKQRKITLECQT